MSWRRWLRLRDRLEGEPDRELRDHAERQVAHHITSGLPEDEARRRARLESREARPAPRASAARWSPSR